MTTDAIYFLLRADTVESRCIPIRMQRRRQDEHIDDFDEELEVSAAEPLRASLAAWAEANIDKLKGTRPPSPAELNDRQRDIWRPLFAIADLAAGDWPQNARTAAVELYKLKDLEPAGYGNFLYHEPTGRLFEREVGEESEQFCVNDQGDVCWLRSVIHDDYSNIIELRAYQERMRADTAQGVAAYFASYGRFDSVVVTAAMIRRAELALEELTLARAEATIRRYEGTIEIRDGRLYISLPGPACDNPVSATTMAACDLLYRSEAFVAAALSSGKGLPDVPATAAGAPVLDKPESWLKRRTTKAAAG